MKNTLKKTLKIASLLIIFFMMVSSFAFASIKNNPSMISESAAMIMMGVVLLGLGGFLRSAISKR